MRLCPVCSWDQLREPAWTNAGPSHEICPRCGTQFGYDDAIGLRDAVGLVVRHSELRDTWLAAGARFSSTANTVRPEAAAQPGSATSSKYPQPSIGDAADNTENHRLLNNVFSCGLTAPITLADPASIDYMASGGHPDIGERVATLGRELPPGSTGYVGGRLTLVHPATRTIIVALMGMGYFLRLTGADFAEATGNGAQTIKEWNTSTTDLAEAAGPTWIVGAWHDLEPTWVRNVWASLET